MTWTCEIDADRRVVVVTVEGDLGDEDLVALYRELKSSPQLRPDFGLLVDLRAAKGRLVTAEGVRKLAGRALVLDPESPRAVVVPSDFGYGMARMYSLWRNERGGVEIFRDIADARRWIGLDEA